MVREFQQLSLIKRKAELQSRVEGRDIPLEEARDWTMKDYICVHFEVRTLTLQSMMPSALNSLARYSHDAP